MMKDTSGGAGYTPRRARSEDETCAPEAEACESVVDSHWESVVEEGICPPAEEASAAPTSDSGRKLRKRRKRAKTKSDGKSEVVSLPSEDVDLSRDWPGSTSARWDRLLASDTSSDSSATTRVQRSATSAAPTDRPTWGYMRRTQEDNKEDEDWGVSGQDAVRKWRDEKMKGKSPPPKVKRGQPEPNAYGVYRDSRGKECPPGWGSPRRASPEDEGGFKPIGEASSCRSPERSGKQKTKRPFNRPRVQSPSTRA
jgi:hypothetical protein